MEYREEIRLPRLQLLVLDELGYVPFSATRLNFYSTIHTVQHLQGAGILLTF